MLLPKSSIIRLIFLLFLMLSIIVSINASLYRKKHDSSWYAKWIHSEITALLQDNQYEIIPNTAPANSVLSYACWRAFKNDHLCALNFDQAFMGVDYYTAVDKSTRLTGSEAPLFVH